MRRTFMAFVNELQNHMRPDVDYPVVERVRGLISRKAVIIFKLKDGGF